MTALPPKPTHDFFPLRFSPPAVSAAERHRMIEHAAYLRAERRHFQPGEEAADWLAAEADVDAQLAQRRTLTDIVW